MRLDKELRLGFASIVRDGDRVRIEDPYSSEEFMLAGPAAIEAVPTHPLNVPKSVATCLYLDFGSPLVVAGNVMLWITMPYEVAVTANGGVLKVVSPFKVKYTVVGTPYEGEVCRWFRTSLVKDPRVWKGVEALGRVKVVFPGTVEPIRGLYVKVGTLKLFTDGDGRVYYESMVGAVKDGVIYASGTSEPPLNGLTPVREVLPTRTAYRQFLEFMEGP